MTSEAPVVVLDYHDLVQRADHLPAEIQKAWGPDGIGLVAVQNVPDFLTTRDAFFRFAHTLAHLPSDYLEDHLSDSKSLYNAGWSYGKEKLKDDKPDTSKGSFYFHPRTDQPGSPEDRAKYPLSYPDNVWPDEEKFKELQGFKEAGQKLGQLLTDVALLLSPLVGLEETLHETDKVKARLLYYYPTDNAQSEDSWIGWHNDSGFLTALAGDWYVNDTTGDKLDQSPDPQAGLYVTTRSGQVHKVKVPPGCMAVQLGEGTQIVSGGAVQATPHCVKGAASSTTARISLACFVDPKPNFELKPMVEGCTREQVLQASVDTDKVPPLGPRWESNEQTFGAFLQKTFALYYDWKQ